MEKPFTFGIIGASGATGKVVVRALHKVTCGSLLIGGRDLEKSQALAAELDARTSVSLVDVLDSASLDTFCRQCAVIINCAGPVCRLEDRVAQAAFRNRCHYVDPAGLTIVDERMRPHDRTIAEAGLRFVISAGWMPGLTELLPIYAHARAKSSMDSVDSVSVYFADSGEWSRNALLDGVWFLRRRGIHGPTYFSRGQKVRAKSAQAMTTVDLGASVASGRFGLYWMPEMEQVGRRLADCDVLSYSYVSGIRNVAASMMLASIPLPEAVSVRMTQRIFERNRFAAGGFAVVKVRGTSRGSPSLATTSVTFDHGRDYWLHGTTLATVARLVADGRDVQPGVHFLAEAFDSSALVAALGEAGIWITERIESAAGAAAAH